jgi:hypothetical protein
MHKISRLISLGQAKRLTLGGQSGPPLEENAFPYE